jgi:hypothetical protein
MALTDDDQLRVLQRFQLWACVRLYDCDGATSQKPEVPSYLRHTTPIFPYSDVDFLHPDRR